MNCSYFGARPRPWFLPSSPLDWPTSKRVAKPKMVCKVSCQATANQTCLDLKLSLEEKKQAYAGGASFYIPLMAKFWRSPVEAGSLSHYLQGFTVYIRGGTGFLPSTVSSSLPKTWKDVFLERFHQQFLAWQISNFTHSTLNW